MRGVWVEYPWTECLVTVNCKQYTAMLSETRCVRLNVSGRWPSSMSYIHTIIEPSAAGDALHQVVEPTYGLNVPGRWPSLMSNTHLLK